MKGFHDFIKKQKTARYLIDKGYENDLVWDTLKNFN
ncbi:MAG: hypothetical protein ACK45I_06105 [Bacteroidota bacterium]